MIAWAVAACARERDHSIGVHYRADCAVAGAEDFFDVLIGVGDGGVRRRPLASRVDQEAN